MSLSNRHVFIAAAVLVAGVSAACGDDTGGSGGGSSATSTSTGDGGSGQTVTSGNTVTQTVSGEGGSVGEADVCVMAAAICGGGAGSGGGGGGTDECVGTTACAARCIVEANDCDVANDALVQCFNGCE